MTKATNNARSNRRGGRVTKTTEGTASMTPEGQKAAIAEMIDDAVADGKIVLTDGEVATVTEQTAETIEARGESEQVPGEAPAPETTDMGQPAPAIPGDAPKEEQPAPVEKPAEPEAAAAPVDPFANLPVRQIEDYTLVDLTDAENGAQARKYEAVHNAARDVRSPMKLNWKHAGAMITMGRNRKEFKPSSVYGTISAIIAAHGRSGIPAWLLVSEVRKRQIGNKRSQYCNGLPPVGWAEGWIDTHVSKGYSVVMAKAAPALTQEVVADLNAKEAEAQATDGASVEAIAKAA